MWFMVLFTIGNLLAKGSLNAVKTVQAIFG
jgi:hypothetical protein